MVCMFQAVLPPIIRSSKTIYSIGYLVKPFVLLATVVEEVGSRKRFEKVPDAVCTVFELLMMGAGTA